METNPRLAYFQSLIGQPMSQSPSGVGRWLQGTLTAAETGRTVIQYVVHEGLVNPLQTLHGGAASAILDEICGLTAMLLGREHAYTSINLNVDFLNPARLGEVIVAEASVIRAGRNIIHVEGRITNTDGKLIARCNTNLAQTGTKI